MNSDYIISCCSTADLTAEHFEKSNIAYICFHYELDGKEYNDDLGQSVSFSDFYEAMKAGAETKTSQVNAEEFEHYFEDFLKQGKDILHVCLSSGLSGVINSANIAKETLEEKYPERKIYIVDSLGASSGYGLIMNKLSELRDKGLGIEEVHEWAEQHKLEMHHWFFSTDLSFYVKGGRISKTSGFVGGMLGICPLLNMDQEGHLIPRKKVRSKNKVIHAIVDCMEQHAVGGLEYSEKCYISQAGCYEDASKVAFLVEARFPNLRGHVEINDVGTTIGSHTGPGTVALFFWGDIRNE
ncbi:MAG: DegV family protein [Ruminococcus sp.]|nr:DegV family protein [Ruminococcus sp.]